MQAISWRAGLSAVILGGTIGGALDLLFALTFAGYNSVEPVAVLQSIASGVIGRAARAGGTPVAALGLALHFLMSWLWAGGFLCMALQSKALRRWPIAAGMAFGFVVFFAMRLVVLPLSAYPFPVNFRPLATTLDLLSHMLLFGVPIAWAVRRAFGAAQD
jgi:uncharacterized membrane protein YagU involved in acid resistance